MSTRVAVALLTSLLALALPDLADARPAGAVKSEARRGPARHQPRDAAGRFLPIPPSRRAVRGTLLGRGVANASRTGEWFVTVTVRPATAERAGSLIVEIPHMEIVSDLLGSERSRQLLARDIHGQKVVIDGTLKVGPSLSTFAPATFTGTIPPGAALSQVGLSDAMRSLQVSAFSLVWARPADGP